MNENILNEMSTTCLSFYRQFLFLKENKEILGRDKELLDETIEKLIDVSVFIGRLKYKIYQKQEQENENKVIDTTHKDVPHLSKLPNSFDKPIWHCYLCKQNIIGCSHQCPNMIAYKENPGKKYCNFCLNEIIYNEHHECSDD